MPRNELLNFAVTRRMSTIQSSVDQSGSEPPSSELALCPLALLLVATPGEDEPAAPPWLMGPSSISISSDAGSSWICVGATVRTVGDVEPDAPADDADEDDDGALGLPL